MSRRFLTTIIFILLALLWGLTTTAQEDLLVVEVSEYTFSPDGDGFEDSTGIYYTLSDSAWSFFAVIMTADTQSVVDTLTQLGPKSAGDDTTYWNGLDSLDQPVPEGDYLLYIQATGLTVTETAYRVIQVDLTEPQATITSIQPSSLIAPGQGQPPLQIFFETADVPPSDILYTYLYIQGPAGAVVEELIDEERIPGLYSIAWTGTTATADGWHKVFVKVEDNGAHIDEDMASIYVDLDPPVIAVTSFAAEEKFQVVPDSVKGYAYDPSGLSTMEMRFRAESPYFDVPVQWTRDDTLFFAAPLADSIFQDTLHSLRFRVSDLVGRVDSLVHRFEWDTTGTEPPVLHAPPGPVNSPYYTVTGEWGDEKPPLIFVYQDGVLIETILTITITSGSEFTVDAVLDLGANEFYAVSEDDAGNVSRLSDVITVVYEARIGLDLPQPFRPNDVFQLNTTKSMVRVRIKLYDLSGDMVKTFDVSPGGVNQTIPWDGLNGQGDTVHRGPLVAVVMLEFADGSTDTIREIFLFDSEAAPGE